MSENKNLIIEIGVAALNVVRVILVDGVVTQVHARVPQVLPSVVVLHRRKPGQNRGYSTGPESLSPT